MQGYYSLPKNQVFTSEIEIQKSRFFGFAKYVNNIEEATQFIKSLQTEYHDAKHIVYAYIIDGVQKSCDDKEPSGTAGKPMLEYLNHNNTNHIVVAVVRYFGGIKLGTGGLSRAYQGCCKNTVQPNFVLYTKGQRYNIVLSYSEYQEFLKTYKQKNIKIVNTKFDNDVLVEIVAFSPLDMKNAQNLGEIFDTIGENNANN